MNTILALLKAGENVYLGGHCILAYSDGTIGCRLEDSLSFGGSEPATMTGLRRIMKWMDTELAAKQQRNDQRERTLAVAEEILSNQPPSTLQLGD